MIRKKQQVWQIKSDLTNYASYVFQHKVNTLVPNIGSEGVKHFQVKSIIAYLLREFNKDFYDEVLVNVGKQPGRIDLINISDRIIIECETNLTKKVKEEKREKYDNSYIADFLFVDLS